MSINRPKVWRPVISLHIIEDVALHYYHCTGIVRFIMTQACLPVKSKFPQLKPLSSHSRLSNDVLLILILTLPPFILFALFCQVIAKISVVNVDSTVEWFTARLRQAGGYVLKIDPEIQQVEQKCRLFETDNIKWCIIFSFSVTSEITTL